MRSNIFQCILWKHNICLPFSLELFSFWDRHFEGYDTKIKRSEDLKKQVKTRKLTSIHSDMCIKVRYQPRFLSRNTSVGPSRSTASWFRSHGEPETIFSPVIAQTRSKSDEKTRDGIPISDFGPIRGFAVDPKSKTSKVPRLFGDTPP
jgi:hypothetical protein